MCGIFGVSITPDSSLDTQTAFEYFVSLALISERRGKEASGFAFRNSLETTVQRAPEPLSHLLKNSRFKSRMFRLFKNAYSLRDSAFTAIGHSRLVTNGSEADNRNNQPVVGNGCVAVHNGIIVNHEKIWRDYNFDREPPLLDSEVICALLRMGLNRGNTLLQSLKSLYEEIYGIASFALVFEEYQNLLLATNNGSLYFTEYDPQTIVFASELFILQKFQTKFNSPGGGHPKIHKISPGSAVLIKMETNEFEVQAIHDETATEFNSLEALSKKNQLLVQEGDFPNLSRSVTITGTNHPQQPVPQNFLDFFEKRAKEISTLKRCKKCVLPETVPFIEFDKKGVCNFCNKYSHIRLKGKDELARIFDPIRSHSEKPDLIVGLSGGRDSSYALHYLVEELGMNPIAYSYDWGMLTDLGRRNQSRMCAKLGVEHALISADIRKKRQNIKLNVKSWLKKPDLGLVPLFMAGDKQYFYYAQKLREEYNIEHIVFGENLFETTFFKYGYCGIEPNLDPERNKTFSMKGLSKLNMMKYYLLGYLKNPSYFNSSLIDTFSAYLSYYFLNHTYINLYEYIPWDEKTVDSTLINQYDWETAPDTDTTWRIGDGTAAFYNYIYYVLGGFSEIETFRSNQIREGQISRDEAIKLIRHENKPRYESIQWYCQIVNIDFEQAMETINRHAKPLIV